MSETEKNQDKQNNQKSKVPLRITNALKNAEKTLSNLNQKLKSLNLKDFNDIVAMENIIRLLDANDTIKNERNIKRRASKKGSSVKVNNSYSVIVANDDLSKNLISLIRRVTQLSNNELENIQESFLTNKIDDIVSSLDSSKNLIDDTKDVVSVLMKYFSAKNTTKYEKESILKDNQDYVKAVAKVKELLVGKDIKREKNSAMAVATGFEIFIPLEGLIDIEKERNRINKEILLVQEDKTRCESKLSKDSFTMS